jgi:hypothetical protein
MMTGGLRQLWKTERRRGIFEALGTGCRVPGTGYLIIGTVLAPRNEHRETSTGKRAPSNEHRETSNIKI